MRQRQPPVVDFAKGTEKEEGQMSEESKTTKKVAKKERNHSALLMAKSRLVCCQKKKAFQGSASVLREFPIRKDEIGKGRQN